MNNGEMYLLTEEDDVAGMAAIVMCQGEEYECISWAHDLAKSKGKKALRLDVLKSNLPAQRIPFKYRSYCTQLFPTHFVLASRTSLPLYGRHHANISLMHFLFANFLTKKHLLPEQLYYFLLTFSNIIYL